MVRLWAFVLYFGYKGMKISIPLWFDYGGAAKVAADVKGLFQFHYGSIMGFVDRLWIAEPAAFQFHYGSIMGLIL